MSIEELTPSERKIYNCGYNAGKKDGKKAVAYLFVGYLFLFILVIKLIIDLKIKQS